MTIRSALTVALALSVSVWLTAAPALAQAEPPGASGRPRAPAPSATTVADTPSELPRPVVTSHEIAIEPAPLKFAATAGAIRLSDERGNALADVVHVSYRLDGADPRRRPVAFVVNGGPGASSAWLQLGAIGPWRLAVDRAATAPSQTPDLVPNPETWLTFTDLVFIDPVGTGYSRTVASGDDARRNFMSVDGDIDLLSATIRRWVEENRRELSPKYFIGESYGGFRGPLVARKLLTEHGVGLSGLVLISPVLDFRTRDRLNPIANAVRLPSMVAAARRNNPALGGPDRDAVEAYAVGDYLRDILKGPRDAAARERLATEVARLTGLSPEVTRRLGGRIGTSAFLREIDRAGGRVASAYDAAAFGLDVEPFDDGGSPLDPVLDGLRAPMTAAARDLFAGRLGWAPRRRYELLSNSVNRQWEWGRSLSPPEAISALGEVMAIDPRLSLLVVHGDADLVTPYLASRMLLDEIAVPGVEKRIRLAVYPGGHMFYFDAASRAAFRDAGRAMIADR